MPYLVQKPSVFNLSQLKGPIIQTPEEIELPFLLPRRGSLYSRSGPRRPSPNYACQTKKFSIHLREDYASRLPARLLPSSTLQPRLLSITTLLRDFNTSGSTKNLLHISIDRKL